MKIAQEINHFYSTADYSLSEVNYLIDLAIRLKSGSISYGRELVGKTLTMLFFNPSLRTRVSFASAMYKLGGSAIDIPIKDGVYPFEFENGVVMSKGKVEHIKEAAKVLSRYCDAIAVRSSDLVASSGKTAKTSSWQEIKKDIVMNSFMQFAEVPVINMESNIYHPCQGLADAVTIVGTLAGPAAPVSQISLQVAREESLALSAASSSLALPSVKQKLGISRSRHPPLTKRYVLTWAPHPKALPMATPNSQIIAACSLGMDVVVAHPPAWDLDEDVLKTAEKRAKEAGGSLSIANNQKEAFKDANFICAKSWGSLKYYGDWENEGNLMKNYQDWTITKEKMVLTDNAYFMHCLPIRRNVVATDAVIDNPNSLIYDQAENRMWVQMAMFLYLLKNNIKN